MYMYISFVLVDKYLHREKGSEQVELSNFVRVEHDPTKRHMND